MLKYFFALVIMGTFCSGNIFAQDTLPAISVKSRDGKVIISWKNAYGGLINNINIQRSVDSIKKFSTIGSVLNPMNKENGYVDTKAPTGNIFYRVFVAFDGGSYVFTKSYKPVPDTIRDIPPLIPVAEEKEEKKEKEIQKIVPNIFVPSKFVFTGKDNNVIINLFDAANRKFTVKFFDENDHPLFEVRVKEPYLILEKVNFLHSGWFKYHLVDNDIILEKYKFYIPKDGKTAATGREQRNK